MIKTRFAPSPTGMLHIGNARTALLNFLFTRKYGGQFFLRIDDTDLERSKDEYKQAIEQDLKWLGLNWDDKFNQSARIARYDEVKAQLIASGRLYPCYETPEELEVKRKFQLSSGKPPIYDRAALKLSEEQIHNYSQQGRKPHYRFLLEHKEISWQDLIKGEIKYHGAYLSDPVVIRADSSMTYMLCSAIDDIDYDISHIFRGEDHVSNTAVQIQMFEALNRPCPEFGHVSLVKAKDDKISKRFGGYEIANMRFEQHIEPMAINSFLALIGTSEHVQPYKNMADLIAKFNINTYSKHPTTYLPEELLQLNHKLLLQLEYEDIAEYLTNNGLASLDANFWYAVRPNLHTLNDLKLWWQICQQPIAKDAELDLNFLQQAAALLPEKIDVDTWSEWTKAIASATGKKGKELFMPLRLALTGMDNGPELRSLLPLLTRQQIIDRLQGSGNK